MPAWADIVSAHSDPVHNLNEDILLHAAPSPRTDDDDDYLKADPDWPLHAKDVSRINFDAVADLATSSAASKQRWLHSVGWLTDDSRYSAVPIKNADGAPAAQVRDDHIAQLVDKNIIKQCRRRDVRGWIKLFLVPELSKKRWRPIKHPWILNAVLGKETLLSNHLPHKVEIKQFAHKGECMISLDFAAFFDQFEYSPDVSRRFCFRHKGKFYRLCTLAMGQRQSVDVAMAMTELLLDFDKSSFTRACVDNVIFVGSRESVLRDAAEFVRRVALVGGTLNEDISDLPALVQSTGPWCGVHLDLVNKTVCLTDKILDKLNASWTRRSRWTWRNFAAHIGLLFWAWGLLDVPMAEFFDVLRFVSKMGQVLQDCDDSVWDTPAHVWPSVWPPLERWSALVARNVPCPVPVQREPEWLMETDASLWGWGYVACNTSTGEVRMHGEKWSAQMWRQHGLKLRRSTFAEPHGIHNALCHLLSSTGPRRVRIGTDSTVARASFERGFNSHSYDINEVLRRTRATFGPDFSIEFFHVPGSINVADSLSRGGRSLTTAEVDAARTSLWRDLGSSSGRA